MTGSGRAVGSGGAGRGPRVPLLRLAAAVAVRPGLWWVALRQALAFARRGWWRRPPFVPLPDASYLTFRLETAYGPAWHDGSIPARVLSRDLVTYLAWCRDWPGRARGVHGRD